MTSSVLTVKDNFVSLLLPGWKDLRIFTRMSAIKSKRPKKVKKPSDDGVRSWKYLLKTPGNAIFETLSFKISLQSWTKWMGNLYPPPPPLINYGKVVHFGFCTASSLNWRWGVAVPFYSVDALVCYTAVFSAVTRQRGRGPLCEDTKYGCVADYKCLSPQEFIITLLHT